ncbi:hypothetical protein WSK_4309 [Novosphingobium sp. Rr 2-17]|uniref:hypothetical protein n=1 Tax=Novosphingobium sp. Rr 2-17 TaxID=555793 RepID=UPI0002697C00|nr:hypothetical protein [Novosphingobium sp. Rr 2-17]EIZ77125.1 hypothetical protein WSK_4309 [Novosphingobium sp. Rr 2-17]
MSPRSSIFAPAHEPVRTERVRTRLDRAIVISLLVMGALNLFVMADQVGAAHAATTIPTHACGAPLA